MPYGLHNLRPTAGSTRGHRRYGRGHGSGRGKTAGRGTKGQKARTGGRKGLKRLGMKRILLSTPKLRGFRSLYAKPAVVNLSDLDRAFPESTVLTPQAIEAAGLIRSTRDGVKVLGGGEVTKAFTLKNCAVSTSAKEKIVAAGGKVD